MMEKKDVVRQWRERNVIDESARGDATYLGFRSGINCDELDSICDELNAEWKEQDSGLRVGWSMGEFIPGFVAQRQLPL